MIGIRIVPKGQDTNNAKPKDRILDTGLETLPIHYQGRWDATVLGPQSFIDQQVLIPHSLGYPPIFRAWVNESFSDAGGGGAVLYKMPRLTLNGFVYSASSNNQFVTISIGFAAPNYTGDSFDVSGYIFIFDNRFDQTLHA